ncbi:pyridoxal phosphate-dependent aminotransferase [Litorivivens sp.]|uniref:pyridoxal phosphate-dependent aminotransferase n=1 Tax=Litorivivens sp. TaxID=2020868 RepID=UPI00356B0309
MKLADLAEHIDGQPMFKILERVQELERAGREIIHFELGEPDFDTPEHIVDACVSSLRSGNTHYAPSSGLHSFKEAIISATEASRGFRPDANQVAVTPGANAVVYLAMKCLVNPGDEVLVPDPGFPTYYLAAQACGVKAVALNLDKENRFALDPAEVENKITSKTRLLILNSPSNPTGAVISRSSIEKIYEICEKRDIFLLSDEIYARMLFSGKTFFSPSVLDKCQSRTIVLNGFSKAFAMTGWRLGVAIGPSELINKMSLLVSTIVSCVPPFIQEAGVAAIGGPQDSIVKMIAEYSKRAHMLANGLNEVKGIQCEVPDGAIYVFADIRGTGLSSENFSRVILEDCGIAVTPGNFFGANGEGFVRFSVVTGRTQIEKALESLRGKFNG